MKTWYKILTAVLSVNLVFAGVAKADTCSKNLTGLFTAFQATKLCATFGTSVSGSIIPGTTNTYDLGDATHTWRTLYLGTSLITTTSLITRVRQDAQRLFTLDASSDTAFTMTFGDGGTTAAQLLSIGASTADADDDSVLTLKGGGASGSADGSRGASLGLFGNESTGSGRADITLGGTANLRVIGNNGATVPLTVNGGAGGGIVIGVGNITMSAAASTLVPGVTSFQINNNENSVANFTIAVAGAVTLGRAGTLVSSGTGALGWTPKAGANTACNTTCVSACVFGIDSAAPQTWLACTDATSDMCLCAGAS